MSDLQPPAPSQDLGISETRIRLNQWTGGATACVSTLGVALSWAKPSFWMLVGLWVCLSVAGGVLGARWRRPNASVAHLMWISTAVFVPICSLMTFLAGGLDSILWVLLPLGTMTSAFAEQRTAWMTALITSIAMAVSLLMPVVVAGEALSPVVPEVIVRCLGFGMVWLMANRIFEGQSRAAASRLESERQQRRILAESVRLQEQTREQRKMEALGRLAGGVAHDFNNLLTVMAGVTDDLTTTHKNTPMAHDLEDLSSAVHQAKVLTRQLLDVSHSSVAEKQFLDLRTLLHESQRIIELILGPSISFEIDAPDTPLFVRGERSELLRVFVNISTNARDAMPGGGRFSIHAALDSPSSTGRAPRVVLTFSDTGQGMTAEIQERALEPFFSTKGHQSGSGLGLATVYSVMTKHNGTVTLQSESGVGTTVTLTLPSQEAGSSLASSPAVAHAPSPPQRPQLELWRPEAAKDSSPKRDTRLTLVLVDDEAIVRRTLMRLLRRSPFEVTSYGRPEDFLADVRDGLHYDVLITDINMPVLSGVDLVRCLEADGVLRPTLFVSGFSPENLDLSEFKGSGYSFLPKPFDGSALREAVNRCMEQAS